MEIKIKNFMLVVIATITLSLFSSCKEDDVEPVQKSTSELITGTWEFLEPATDSPENQRWTFTDSTFTEQFQDCHSSECDPYYLQKSGDYEVINEKQLVICYEQTVSRGINKVGPTTTEKVSDTLDIISVSESDLVFNLENEDKSFSKFSADVIIPVITD